MTAAVEWFVTGLTAYAAFGVAFAILFVTAGVSRVDPVAKGAGAGFRLMIFPGAAALWPILLMRWAKGSS